MSQFYLDVNANGAALHRFEVSFADAAEAVQHSKDLAANFRLRHVPNQRDLVIVVSDQSGRTIHEECVSPRHGKEQKASSSQA